MPMLPIANHAPLLHQASNTQTKNTKSLGRCQKSMFSFTRYRKTSCIESDTSEDERSEDNNYDRHEIGLDDSGSGSNYDDLEEDESEEELKQYTMKQLKVKLAARGLFLGGNKPDLIQRLLNPQPSDFKYKTDENDDDDDDDARIGFDDPVETNTPVETAESESEEVLNECTVKQLKIKLLERGLLVSGTKPQLIQRNASWIHNHQTTKTR